MIYERPKLVSLADQRWKIAGQCNPGGSNRDPSGCTSGGNAVNGSCGTGLQPSTAASCSFGNNAGGPGCQSGNTTATDCNQGFNASTCTTGLGLA